MSNLPVGVHTPPMPLEVSRAALFLDIDGTLLDLAARPQDVAADAALCSLLRSLEGRLGGALAMLTGRSLEDADRVLSRSVFCVAALHGQDCRVSGVALRQPPAEGLARAKQMVQHLVEAGALDADLEDKGGALALHYRSRPEQGPLIARAIEEIAKRHGLRPLHGKMVSELLPFGATKGVAVSTLMRRPPFAGRVPIAIGDDVTDEDAFDAVNALDGVSIVVGSRTGTGARYMLADVAAVRAWLAAAL